MPSPAACPPSTVAPGWIVTKQSTTTPQTILLISFTSSPSISDPPLSYQTSIKICRDLRELLCWDTAKRGTEMKCQGLRLPFEEWV